jgi:hypothetical protein
MKVSRQNDNTDNDRKIDKNTGKNNIMYENHEKVKENENEIK